MKVSKELISLWVAYILLVGVVVWATFEIEHTLERIEQQACVTAELSVVSELGILATFGEQPGVDEVMRDRLREVFIEFNDIVVDACPAVERVFLQGPQEEE